MICGHWAMKNHTSIRLCQEEGEKEGLDAGLQGTEGEGANRAPNHILHLWVILGVCTCVHSKCGALRVSKVFLSCLHSTVAA